MTEDSTKVIPEEVRLIIMKVIVVVSIRTADVIVYVAVIITLVLLVLMNTIILVKATKVVGITVSLWEVVSRL